MKNAYRPGQTLVEVAVATLIAAMTATAAFSVVLSGFMSSVKADKRDAVAMILQRAQENLKSYVSIEPANANIMGTGFSPARPGSPGTPAGHWAADLNAGWALAAGQHDISSLLAGTSLNSPSSSLVYTVTNSNCLANITVPPPVPTDFNQCKQVVFTLTYPD